MRERGFAKSVSSIGDADACLTNRVTLQAVPIPEEGIGVDVLEGAARCVFVPTKVVQCFYIACAAYL